MPCEISVRKILPAVRAAVAVVFVKEYGLSSYKAAKLLGLTPAAVSNYLAGRRGYELVNAILSDGELKKSVEEIASNLLREGRPNIEYLQALVCSLCRQVREKIGA